MEYTRPQPTPGVRLNRSFRSGDNGEGGIAGENPGGKDGGPCRTRTYNQLIKSQLLYQIELTAQKRVRMEPKTVLKSKL